MGKLPAFLARFVDRLWNDPDAPINWAKSIVYTIGGFAGAGLAAYLPDLAPYIGVPDALVEPARWCCITIAGGCGWGSVHRAPSDDGGTS